MKRMFFNHVGVLGFFILLSSCGGDRSTLEEAGYVLGKGGVANGAKAATMLTSLIISNDLNTKFKALELYAGAKAAAAGFNSIQIFSKLVYGEGDNTVAKLKNSVTLQADAQSLLDDAERKLQDFTGVAAFSNGTASQRGAIYFQLGMIRLFQAFRTAFVDSGLSADTFDATACRTGTLASTITSVDGDLTDSRTALLSASLTDRGVGDSNNNGVLRLVDSFQAQTSDITALCNYLNTQRSL